MEWPQLNHSPVIFVEGNHTYWLDGKQLKGVTGTLVRRAYPHTYDTPAGMSKDAWNETLRNAANKGTSIHQSIELYEDLGVISEIPELNSYISIKEDNGFVNLATEYIVSDEEHYASAVDHVWYHEETDGIYLIDIKRTATIHYPEVTCQLSVYKKFFERQNPHLKVAGIAVLWLRGNKSEFKILNPLADEVVDALIDSDLQDRPFDMQESYGDLPAKFADAENMIAALDAEIKEKKAQYDKISKGLLELMNQNGIQKFTGSKIQLTVISPTTREGFDKNGFKVDYPELYEKYKTSIEVKPSLKITIKK